MDSAIRTISSLFALAAFGVGIVAGVWAHNSASTVLSNALICMVLCRVLGWFVAQVAVRITEREIAMYHQDNPIPDVHSAMASSTEAAPLLVEPVAESTKSSQTAHRT